MEKGRFEAPKGKTSMSSQNDPYIMSERRDRSTLSKLWPVLAAVAGVLALVVGILIITKSRTNHPAETTRSTLVMTGMPRITRNSR